MSQTLQQELETLRREYTDFTYRVSHDFSAPVRTVTEFSRLLRDECASQLDSQSLLYLGLIIQAGEKMRAMFDGLLTLSRLNTDPAQPETVDLAKLAADLAGQYGTMARISIGPLPPVKVAQAHAFTLLQVLLENAVKFVPSGGVAQVRISALADGSFVRISIRDEGIGIAPEFHEDIFTVFRRLHKESVYPGLGLGLALAQRIVSLYGGKIWVESDEGRGATFHFTLPAA